MIACTDPFFAATSKYARALDLSSSTIVPSRKRSPITANALGSPSSAARM